MVHHILQPAANTLESSCLLHRLRRCLCCARKIGRIGAPCDWLFPVNSMESASATQHNTCFAVLDTSQSMYHTNRTQTSLSRQDKHRIWLQTQAASTHAPFCDTCVRESPRPSIYVSCTHGSAVVQCQCQLRQAGTSGTAVERQAGPQHHKFVALSMQCLVCNL